MSIKQYFQKKIYWKITYKKTGIKKLLKKDEKLLVQLHPRDNYNYEISKKRKVTVRSIQEVEIPIFFSSSLIEKCLINERKFYLLSLNLPEFNSHLEIYKNYSNFNNLARSYE